MSKYGSESLLLELGLTFVIMALFAALLFDTEIVNAVLGVFK